MCQTEREPKLDCENNVNFDQLIKYFQSLNI